MNPKVITLTGLFDGINLQPFGNLPLGKRCKAIIVLEEIIEAAPSTTEEVLLPLQTNVLNVNFLPSSNNRLYIEDVLDSFPEKNKEKIKAIPQTTTTRHALKKGSREMIENWG